MNGHKLVEDGVAQRWIKDSEYREGVHRLVEKPKPKEKTKPKEKASK